MFMFVTYFAVWVATIYLKIKQWYSIPDTLSFENNFAVLNYTYRNKNYKYYIPCDKHDEFMYQNTPITLHINNNNKVLVHPFIPIYPLTNSHYSIDNDKEFTTHDQFLDVVQEDLYDIEEEDMVQDILSSKVYEEIKEEVEEKEEEEEEINKSTEKKFINSMITEIFPPDIMKKFIDGNVADSILKVSKFVDGNMFSRIDKETMNDFLSSINIPINDQKENE